MWAVKYVDWSYDWGLMTQMRLSKRANVGRSKYKGLGNYYTDISYSSENSSKARITCLTEIPSAQGRLVSLFSLTVTVRAHACTTMRPSVIKRNCWEIISLNNAIRLYKAFLYIRNACEYTCFYRHSSSYSVWHYRIFFVLYGRIFDCFS